MALHRKGKRLGINYQVMIMFLLGNLYPIALQLRCSCSIPQCFSQMIVSVLLSNHSGGIRLKLYSPLSGRQSICLAIQFTDCLLHCTLVLSVVCTLLHLLIIQTHQHRLIVCLCFQISAWCPTCAVNSVINQKLSTVT